MSNQTVQHSISDNSEFQNKSLQGRLFCESIINCLQGDDDFVNTTQPYQNTDIDAPSYKYQEGIEAKKAFFECENQNSQDVEDIYEVQQNAQVNVSSKSKKDILSKRNDSRVISNQAEINKKIINQKQNIKKPLEKHKEDNLKVELNNIEKLKEVPLQETKCISNIQRSQYKFGKQNIANYERAANIINKILNKSMNRVQRINKHVKNFIQILKYRKNNRAKTKLSENEYQIINDKAFTSHQKIRENILNKFVQKLYRFAKLKMPIPLFMPTNSFRVYWDILQTIYIYLFIYIYSILIFFAMQNQDTVFIKQYYKCTLILFLIDTLVTLNTAYFKKDTIIANRKQIAWKYFSSSVFMADAISLITMGSKLIFQNSCLVYNPDNSLSTFIINLLVFFKLKCVSIKKKRFSYAFTLNDHQKHVMKLLNQLLSVVFVAHLVCLAWYTLGQYEIQNQYSVAWIQKYNLDGLPYIQLYIYSMYWSVTTMTTVIEINSRFLKNNAIFSANFSSQILRKLVFIMEEVIISPNEIIFEEGDYDDQSVYFIESGKIEIYQTPSSHQITNNLNEKSKTHTLQVLSKDSIFGEISFFSGLARNASARSINLSTLYRINRSSFIDLILENSEDFERFKMMEEQIKFLQDNQILYLECYACKCMGHLAKDCPKVHQKFDSQFLVLKHNFSLFQERQRKAKRRFSDTKYNARMNVNENQITCQVLKENIRYLNSEIEILFQTDEDVLLYSSNYEEQISGELQSTNNQTSQSSLKAESSNKSINEKQMFKSDRSINSTQKDQQINNSLQIIKSQIQLGKQSSHIKSQRDSLKDNKIIENLENLFLSERQISGINNNTINIKSIQAKKNFNQFDEDQTMLANFENDQCYKENLDKLEKNMEEFKEQMNPSQEQFENQSIQSKLHNSKIQNMLKLSSSANKDSSYKSLQENSDERGKIRPNRPTIKFNPNNQEDCNISNQSYLSDEDAQKENQGLGAAIKKQKSKKIQQSQNELRSSIDNYVYNGIYSACVAQSLALYNAQNQINKFESTVNKLDEKIQTLYEGKSLQNFERNSLLHIYKRNTSSIFSNLSKRKFGSYEQRASLFQDLDSNTIKTYDRLSSSKRFSYKSKNSVEVIGQNSWAFTEQSQSQKVLQKFYKMINSQADEYLKQANQKSSTQRLQNQDFDFFILDQFDVMRNYKKFFPYNNFSNILSFKNNSQQKLKKKTDQSKSTKQRRQNIFIKQNSDRRSIFCNKVLQQSQFSEIDYEKYKPTYLSYGVSQITEFKFPKINISLKML
ncbi:hypothetical protein ABPG72_021809 [Tetrahymena utriculariae]